MTNGYIEGIFVSDMLQSKGVGKKILDYAKSNNNTLSLKVYKKNGRAVNFYIREEFVVVDEQVDINTSEVELVMQWAKWMVCG